jgi:hypothetical protein
MYTLTVKVPFIDAKELARITTLVPQLELITKVPLISTVSEAIAFALHKVSENHMLNKQEYVRDTTEVNLNDDQTAWEVKFAIWGD